MENNKKVLLFNINAQKRKQIEELCAEKAITVIIVDKKNYAEKLGALAKVSGMKMTGAKYAGLEFPSEMMIFSGMDSKNLDEFLDEYKIRQIQPVYLKAVITIHNIYWTAEALYKELFKEHNQMK